MLEHFATPSQLLFLLVLLPGYFILLAINRRRQSLLARLGVSAPSELLRVILPILIIAALLLGLARPHAGYQEIQVSGKARDIMLVVDVSKSMLTRDVEPNRLEFAKRKLMDLLDLLPKISRGDRLGIVLFAGDSYRFLPLTTDYQVARTFVSAISTQLIRQGGSSLKAGLQSALESLQRVRSISPLVLLITDGEDLVNGEGDISALLSRQNVTLSALGVGTPEGKPIDVDAGYFLKDAQGNIVVSKLREELLQHVSASGKGKYARAVLGDADLRLLLDDNVTAHQGSDVVDRLRVYRELGPFILCLPLICLLFMVLARKEHVIFLVPILLSALIYSSPCLAQELSPYDAHQRLQSGDYEAARQGFLKELGRGSKTFDLLSNLAASEHRLEKYKEAAKHFSEAAALASDGKDKFEALYNSGTAALFGKDFDSAIKALESALQIKPGDEHASTNLEIARQMKEQQPPPQSQSKKPQASPSPTPSAAASPSPDKQESQNKEGQQDEDKPGQGSSSNDNKEEQKPAETPSPAPQATATPAEASTPQAEASPSPEASQSDDSTPSPAEPTAGPEETPLGSEESRAWLESLDDSPVLLKPKQQKQRLESGQTW